MEALFFKVLGMSATASVVILAVLLARVPLRRAPKVFSYALWAVVLFRLLCPFSIKSAFSLLPAVRTQSAGDGMETVQIHTGILVVNNQVNGYLAEHPYPAAGASAPAQGTLTNQGVPDENAPLGSAPAEKAPLDWLGLGRRVWLAGIVLLLGYSLISLLRLRSRLVGSVPLAGEKNVRLADHIPSPFVLGLVFPRIYLPSDLPEGERDYILLHERTHIRRGDHILRALAWLALSLHWFNPLVWLAFHLAGKDMEMSCDEAVLRDMGRDVRADYSSSLLRLSTGKRLPVGPLAFGDGDPQGRIKNVLNYKKPALWVMAAALIAVVCAGAALATDSSTLISPASVSSVSVSARRFYADSDTMKEDLLSQSNSIHIVSGKDGDRLIRAINSYRKTVYVQDGQVFNTSLDDWVRIDCTDGGMYLLHYWYWNGFSVNPFHYGEDDYTTLVTYYDAQGNEGTTWQMEYNFDGAFQLWQGEVVWPVRRGEVGPTRPSRPADLTADLTLSLDTEGEEHSVRISGSVGDVALPRGAFWSPPHLFPEYPYGWLSMVYPDFTDGIEGHVTAGWADEGHTAITLDTQMTAMLSSYAPSGWWKFTVDLNSGTVTEMTAAPLQQSIPGAEVRYYPESISDAEAVKAARIAARLITEAESYYKSRYAETQQILAGIDLSRLTFSDDWENQIVLEGLDSGEMRWLSPYVGYPQGVLTFTDPDFLGPAFEERSIRGAIAWADEEHTSMMGWLSVSEQEWEYRFTEFTVDLDGGSVARDMIDIGLSDENVFFMARIFAGLLDRVEEYRVSDAYRHSEEALLPFDKAMEMTFGGGWWRSRVLLYSDGTFVGEFGRTIKRSNDIWISQFHGRFGDIAQATDGAWSMVLEEMVLDTERPIGEEWIVNGIHYISSIPLGFDTADGRLAEPGARFMFFTPDAAYAPGAAAYGMRGGDTNSVLYEFERWWEDPADESLAEESDTLGCYALRNMETGGGFSVMGAWGDRKE